MYSVVVCEDEEIIRRKIMHGIDWHANGFSPVIPASTGEEAAALLTQGNVDILITDIRMPGMSGIQLVEKARKTSPGMKVVVISGYSEFEYARALMKLEVHDYVLKPFRSNKLLRILLEMRKGLEDEALHRRSLESLHDQISKSDEMLFERLMIDAVEHGPSREFERAADRITLPLFAEGAVCAAVLAASSTTPHVSHPDGEESGVAALSVAKRFIELNNLKWKAFLYGERELALLIAGETDEAEADLDRLRHTIFESTSSACTAGIGTPRANLNEVWISLREARVAAGMGFVHGTNETFRYQDIAGQKLTSGFELLQQSQLYDHLREGAFSEIREDIHALFSKILHSSFDGSIAAILAGSLAMSSCVILHEMGQEAQTIFGDAFDPLHAVRQCRDIAELEEWVHSFFGAIERHSIDDRIREQRSIGEELKKYVDTNYDKEMSLDHLARRFGRSPSYISLTLSSHLGERYVDYLSSLRIRRAKELLRYTDLRIYEIAERVGFHDAYYFSTRFRKATGASPKQYRMKTTFA
ncbi:MAG TPA: response regulator [Spirochaetia bacterium]|nr:response regulator [Spirochaetia bacterium]